MSNTITSPIAQSDIFQCGELTPKEIKRFKHLLNKARIKLSSQYDSTGVDCCQYLLSTLEGGENG